MTSRLSNFSPKAVFSFLDSLFCPFFSPTLMPPPQHVKPKMFTGRTLKERRLLRKNSLFSSLLNFIYPSFSDTFIFFSLYSSDDLGWSEEEDSDWDWVLNRGQSSEASTWQVIKRNGLNKSFLKLRWQNVPFKDNLVVFIIVIVIIMLKCFSTHHTAGPVQPLLKIKQDLIHCQSSCPWFNDWMCLMFGFFSFQDRSGAGLYDQSVHIYTQPPSAACVWDVLQPQRSVQSLSPRSSTTQSLWLKE